MRAAASLALVGLVRSPARTATRVLVLAAAVGLLGAMLLFIGNSLRTMTGSAIRSVPLDWQGPVGVVHRSAERWPPAVARQPGVRQASPRPHGAVRAASATPARRGVSNAGAGSVAGGAARDTSATSHVYRFLQGQLEPGQIVLDQQLAATLQARIGDTVTLTPRPGARPRAFRVSGVALITAPDTVFQPLNPQLGPAPAQPPSNAAIMPLDDVRSHARPRAARDRARPASAPRRCPARRPACSGRFRPRPTRRCSATPPPRRTRRSLQIVNRVERIAARDRCTFVDNLSDKLNTAAGDALYAETLYIMLALPGALVGLGLAYLAALGTVERDRRELALLRARGATRAATCSGWRDRERCRSGCSPGWSAPALAIARRRSC